MQFPPSPRLPRPVQILNWALRPGQFLESCHRNHGDLFALHLELNTSKPYVFVADPKLTKELFRDPSLTVAGETRASLAGIVGRESILLTDGEEHASQRRWLRPGLQQTRLERHRQEVVDAIDVAIDSWPCGRPFSIRPSVQAAALEVITRIIFGKIPAQRRAEIGRRVDALLGLVANRSAFLALALPERLRTRLSTKALDGPRRSLDALILEEIRMQAVGGGNSSVLLDLLTGAERAGVAFSEQAVCDQVRTLLLAGHESTATSLAWTIAHLVREPGTLDRLTVEVRSGGDGTRYADAVISESLRLTPPLPGAQRKLAVPLETNGYFLPRGTLVAPSAYLIHRREDLYPNSHAFRPERFLDDTSTVTWMPFGGGSRRCPGASMARLQLNVMLQRICERTRLRAKGPRETIRRRGLVLAPARGGRVVLVDRRGS